MAIVPTYVGAGTYTNGTGALSVPEPSGVQNGDLLVLFCESENQDIATPANWTQIGTAQGTGTAGNATSARLEVFYRFRSGTGNTTVANSGDHTSAIMLAFRGVDPSTPFSGTPVGNVAASATTAVTIPGVTTSHNNTLVVAVVAGSADTATAQFSGQTNANLSSLTERVDVATTQGDGGSITVITGEKVTAGATGNTTGTLATSSVQARLCFALKPITDFTLLASPTAFISSNKSAFMGVNGDLLLEDFEQPTFQDFIIPLVWLSPSNDHPSYYFTTSLSSSHTGEYGPYSTKVEGSCYSNNYFANAFGGQYSDLTGYTTVLLELYIESVPASGYIEVILNDVDYIDYAHNQTPVGETGSFSLPLTISDWSSESLKNVSIQIRGSGGTPTGDNQLVAYFQALKVIDEFEVETEAFDFNTNNYNPFKNLYWEYSSKVKITSDLINYTQGIRSWEATTSTGTPFTPLALIEGFESFSSGLPNTLPWDTDISAWGVTTNVSTITQVTSNVSQGTYACRLTGTTASEGDAGGMQCLGAGLDLSAYETLALDITDTTGGIGAYLYILVFGSSGIVGASTMVGTGKCHVSLSGDRTLCGLFIIVGPTAGYGFFDITIDNIQGGYGGPIFAPLKTAFNRPPERVYLAIDIDVVELPIDGSLGVALDYSNVSEQQVSLYNPINTLGLTTVRFEIDWLDVHPSWAFNVSIAPMVAGGDYTYRLDNMRMTDDPGTVDFPIEAETGSFALTGQDVNFSRTRKALANTGALTLAGVPNNLAYGRKLIAAPTSYTLTASNAGLMKGFTATTPTAIYTLTGPDVKFRRTYNSPMNAGAMSLTGIAARLARLFTMAAAPRAHTLTGVPLTLRQGHNLTAVTSSYTLTGIAVDLDKDAKVIAQSGSFVLSGVNASMIRNRTLFTQTRAFTYEGVSTRLIRAKAIPTNTFNTTFYSPTFVGERTVTKIHPPITNFVIETQSIGVASGANIGVPLKEFVITSGASYAKIQLVTCTGDPVPLDHVKDSKELNADAYIDLFEITLAGGTNKLYLKMNHTVEWQGNSYEGTGIKIEGVGTYADDEVARPKLTIFNPEGVFSYLVNEGLLENARVARIRVLKQHIEDDVPVYRRQQWYVKRVASLRRGFIGLELRDMLDGQNFLTPGRMFIPPDFPMVSLQ